VKEKSQRRASARRSTSAPSPTEGAGADIAPQDINDKELLATQAREAVEKSAAELRKQRVPITTEPPTVYRP
jgi:hypothetical protein